MSSRSHATATRNGPRSDGEDYAVRSNQPDSALTARVLAPGAMAGLQGTMGNAFVAKASRGGVPTAPAAVSTAPEDEDYEDYTADSEGSTTEPTASAGDPGSGEPSAGDSGGAAAGDATPSGQSGPGAYNLQGEGATADLPLDDHKDEKPNDDTISVDERATGEGAGGPEVVTPAFTNPSVAKPGMAGFFDGGRMGTAPMQSVFQCNYCDMMEDGHPHAFISGGRTGDVPWGGGAGAGPKGNEASGSYTEDPPKYESKGNWWDNADAWVESGGNVDVKRSYISSNAGDQGNGWWVTPLAAKRLEAHEALHVTAAKSNYDTYIAPMLAKVADSRNLGRGKTFWSSDAIALLQQQISWSSTLKKFKEQDEMDNGKYGMIDQRDMASDWPRRLPAMDIGGKVYNDVLLMNSEPDPGKPVSQGPPAATP